MLRKLVLTAFALGLFASVAAPKPAAAQCDVACFYYHGKLICPCK